MNEPSQNGPILHIHLLGDLHLVCGDEPITSVNTQRLQSLLAYLLLHRDAPLSRHHLAFVLWPDSTDAQALTNLRNLLHLLRQALPEAERFLNVDRHTLQWHNDAPFTLDVTDFEHALAQADEAERAGNQAAVRQALEEAVARYQGDLLPSCYDDWIRPDRERLQQAYTRALERLARLLEDLREYRPALDYAQRLLRHDPLNEAAYRRLMRLHALAGDRASALRVYHTCATVLQRELGVEPGPATRRAYERLLQADTLPLPAPAPTVGLAATLPLVGRHQEWARAQGAWRAAAAGRPHFLLISGEAGIGKTRLAEELLRWAARQGIATATARCYAAEAELAYAPVAAWLRSRPLPPLEPVWRSEVARLLPELLVEHPDLPPPGPLAEPWQRRRFFEALTRTILGSGQPLLLLLDRLAGCDAETLAWLAYLLHAEDEHLADLRLRLLILGTIRPEEMDGDHSLASLLPALHIEEQLTEIELRPLDEADTATLAAHVAGRELDSDLAACLYHETEGNPLFVVETVRAGLSVGSQAPGTNGSEVGAVCLPRPLPSKMQAAIEMRLAYLSLPARELAGVAATIGREFTFPVLARASDLNEDALVRALDELWQRRIVREQGTDAYDFSHDKLREVAYAGLSAARRRWLHRRVAEALQEMHTTDPGSVSAQVAMHFERAGQPEQAVQYYQQAAQAAQRIYAPEQADRYHRRAQALLETSH
jgi:DNA-binding SARP family transcriptional activator/predicted ATPase